MPGTADREDPHPSPCLCRRQTGGSNRAEPTAPHQGTRCRLPRSPDPTPTEAPGGVHLGWPSARPLARPGPRAPQRFRLDRPPSPVACSLRSDPVPGSCRPPGRLWVPQPKSEFLSAHPYHHHLTHPLPHPHVTITSPLSPTLSRSAGARWDLGSGAIRDRTRCVPICAGSEAMWPHTGGQTRIASGGATGPPIRTPTPTPDGKGLGSLRRNAGEQADHWRAHLFAVCRGKV